MTSQLKHVSERYPTVPALTFLLCGIVTAKDSPTALLWWSLPVWILSLGILLLGLKRTSKVFLWVATGLLFFSTGLNLALKGLTAGRDFIPHPGYRAIQGTVVDTLASGPDFRVLLLAAGLDHGDRTELPGLGRLTIRHNSVSLGAGDRIAFRAKIRKPRNRGNPGEYDWEMHCRNDGILWTASARGDNSVLVITRGCPYKPGAMVFSLRQAMTRFLEEQSTGDVRAVLKAIVVGDCGEITPALNKSYANSGLIHMLSASGQHVAIVAAMTLMLTMMLARATPRLLLYFPLKKVAATASIPAMVIYCLLVGARAPAIRSTIMGLVVASAILLERKWHSLNSLALAGLIILLIYPLSLFTPSFQLSFAAVFGILFVVPQLAGRLFGRELETEPGENAHKTKMAIKGSTSTLSRWLRYVVVLIFTSLAATAAITPIILSLFHYFPVYTVLANLIADPVLAVALPMALGASIIGTIFPSLGALVLMPAAVLIGIINRLAETFSSLPGSTITAKHMEGMQFVLLTVLAFGFMWFLRGAHWRASRAIAVASVLTAACLISWPLVRSEERDLTVTFLNVGKADAMFVKPHGSNGLLIDGGSRTPEFDAGRSILLPFLQWYGARRIDCMVISHPDSDHLGGLLSVMTEVPPARLWWNEVDSNSSLLKEILCAVRSSGIPVLQADRFCSPVRLGKAELRFLNPPAKLPGGAARFRGTNDASIVCRLDYGETSFLFTGDAERPAESELLDAGAALRATVLKVAHHGCKTSSSWAFLEAVRPRYAVISCDDYPESKCPDPKVLERLKLIGAEILWTGKDGAVIFSTDGKKLVVKTGRNRKPM